MIKLHQNDKLNKPPKTLLSKRFKVFYLLVAPELTYTWFALKQLDNITPHEYNKISFNNIRLFLFYGSLIDMVLLSIMYKLFNSARQIWNSPVNYMFIFSLIISSSTIYGLYDHDNKRETYIALGIVVMVLTIGITYLAKQKAFLLQAWLSCFLIGAFLFLLHKAGVFNGKHDFLLVAKAMSSCVYMSIFMTINIVVFIIIDSLQH